MLIIVDLSTHLPTTQGVRNLGQCPCVRSDGDPLERHPISLWPPPAGIHQSVPLPAAGTDPDGLQGRGHGQQCEGKGRCYVMSCHVIQYSSLLPSSSCMYSVYLSVYVELRRG